MYENIEYYISEGGPDVPTRVIAVILDNEVVEVLRFDERVASILLSNPTFIDISNISVETGWTFDGQNFVATINGTQAVVPAPTTA